jgi:small subunit ribosomal protein S13
LVTREDGNKFGKSNLFLLPNINKFIMSFIIFGIKLPAKKKIAYALPLLYGIGLFRGQQICRSLGLSPQLEIKDLTSAQKFAIAKKLKEEYIIEGNLEEEIKKDLQRVKQNGSRRGYRLRNGLPTRGQRTHSNGKTARRRISTRS